MNKKLLIGLGILFAIIGIAVAFVFTRSPAPVNPTPPAATLPSAGSAPSSGTVDVGTQNGSPNVTFSVAGPKGSSISVRDFVSDADVVSVATTSRSGVEAAPYYSLGSLPYGVAPSLATESLPSSVNRGYEILYFPDSKVFSIFLYAEPIGATRLRMQQDLEQRLSVSAAQLCNLVSYVRVSPLANVFYAGKNIGFSGCPGAMTLPLN